MIDIFLSRPTWVAPQFERGLDAFLQLLDSCGLKPRTLGTTDYPAKAPLDEVCDLMGACQGAIILGYPQIEIATGTLKGRAIERLSLGTEWNHIEAALAYSQRMPLLLIHHEGIGRGVFDRGTLNSFVYSRDLTDGAWSLARDLNGALTKWRSTLRDRQTSELPAADASSSSPKCPNCSTASKAVYLRRLPRDFIEVEGAAHECTKCGYKRSFAIT